MTGGAKVLLLYTGGTIGMIKDELTGALMPFRFENLLSQIPELNQLHCRVDTDSFDAPVDSSSIGPEHWQRLAQRIAEDYHDYDGFVVLHGSDTMAYTSSALSFMLNNLSKPVILTGSQLPIGIPRSDARENLLTSMEVVLARNEEGGSRVPEVAVYFENDLMRGNRLHKISTQDFEAFQSLNYPKLAEAGVKIKYNNTYIAKSSTGTFSVNTAIDSRVGVLTIFPGIMPDFALPILQNKNLSGIIIRSFGSGNVPMYDWLLKGVEDCLARGTRVVNITQCDGGGVFMGQYESSRTLLNMGVISAFDMTFEAALTKMMHLLARNLSKEAFKDLYEFNLKGELSS